MQWYYNVVAIAPPPWIKKRATALNFCSLSTTMKINTHHTRNNNMAVLYIKYDEGVFIIMIINTTNNKTRRKRGSRKNKKKNIVIVFQQEDAISGSLQTRPGQNRHIWRLNLVREAWLPIFCSRFQIGTTEYGWTRPQAACKGRKGKDWSLEENQKINRQRNAKGFTPRERWHGL